MNGQVHLEALLVIAFFLGILALFLLASKDIQIHTEQFAQQSTAITESKKCALLIDAMYSNSGGHPVLPLQNCSPSAQHQIKVHSFETEKTAYTIAPATRLLHTPQYTTMEVTTPDHYQ